MGAMQSQESPTPHPILKQCNAEDNVPHLRQMEGTRFLERTKLDRRTIGQMPHRPLDQAESCTTDGAAIKIALPNDWLNSSTDFWQMLSRRRSQRRYQEEALSLADLAALLWACQGVTAKAGDRLFRTAPSAGALYPVETYVAVERVEGVPAGLYHYSVRDFSLAARMAGSCIMDFAEAAAGQRFIGRGAVLFLWTAVLWRTMGKYGDRGLRYILLDAGHICQNLLLASCAIGRQSCPIAAFYDDATNQLLGIDSEEETIIYMAVVG